ncbi:MAG: LysR family transcriptional regulator [Myxococcales bacterium]|nr:LysR family transcriptional regulator [Myxococcales bacterium]
MQGTHVSAMDLNLLTALDALLEERNVTRAAARVGLTQSAMSHKLRRLREMFDDDLLVGGRHGMVPTERAEALAGPVRRGLLELQAAIRSTEPFDPATAERSFTIITSDYADFVILPRVLAHLERHAPGVTIRILPPSDASHARLEDGTADLVMGLALEGSGLKQRVVFEETFVALVREGHPTLAHDEPLSLARYLELGHVLVSGDDQPGPVDQILAAQGLARRIALRTPYFVGVPFIVSRSDLVATMPRALAQEASSFAALRLLTPPVALPSFRITMTWHERAHRDPAHVWLRELSRRLTVEALQPEDPPKA